MSAAVLLAACRRIDAGAAAVRVFLIGCKDGAAETDRDNVAQRQMALRAVAEVLTVAQKELQSAPVSNDFDSLSLCFFVELVCAAEQALWVALGDHGEGAPSNADLCELLGLALQFHAESKAAWSGQSAGGSSKADKRTKGGAA